MVLTSFKNALVRKSFVLLGIILLTGGPAWGYEVWVSNQGLDKVHILDGETLKELAAISTERKPHNIEFSPDFRRAYVSNVGAGTVAVIDAVERKVINTIPTGKGAHGVNRSPDGRLLYVTNTQDETVSVIDTASLDIVKTIPVGPVPSVAIFTPDGKKAYIANVSGSLSVIDVEKGDVIRKVPDLDGAIVLTISKDGKKVYVARGFSDKVAVVDTQTDRVRSNVSVGKDGHSVWTTPDGKFVWVPNRLAKSISVIATDQDRVVRTIQNVGDKPDILAFSPDGKKAFVGLRGRAETGDPKILSGREPGLSVVDVASGKVLTKIKLGGDPHGVAVRP
ncbi:MAG TPA: cytochrome D1 domain-containing protein [Methylomirabilota bacterium]|nr:cytochrome D1 domain-containing protein [Methylomirabilota bacterium]